MNDAWVASDGSSSGFSFDAGNTPTYNKKISILLSEGWITSDTVLAPEHDAAHVQWGGEWRMPTCQELNDLKSKCDWTWAATNGVNGYIAVAQANRRLVEAIAVFGHQAARSCHTRGFDGAITTF